jgi:hypothetical protein
LLSLDVPHQGGLDLAGDLLFSIFGLFKFKYRGFMFSRTE